MNYQAELAELESKLEKLDSTDEQLEAQDVSTGLASREKDVKLSKDQQGLSRQNLLADIKAKLLEYGWHHAALASNIMMLTSC